MDLMDYREKLGKVKGKTIALVYIFEDEAAEGYGHYDIWKSDVISGWLNAVQELHCLPFILDARTFISKAMDHTLPKIDFVINLNAGNTALSTLGLIPSVCSFLAIPCIPCETTSIIAGEDKRIANCIAGNAGFHVPKALPHEDKTGIFRPINYGSSRGVKRGTELETIPDSGIYQEFIAGYDFTTPIMYNPLTERMELLPTLLYCPEEENPQWYLGEKEKALHSGFNRKKILSIAGSLQDVMLRAACAISVATFCRIDARIKAETPLGIEKIISRTLALKDVFFVEINPMPTIRVTNNFYDSICQLGKSDIFFECYEGYKSEISNGTPIGFILSCSMIALS